MASGKMIGSSSSSLTDGESERMVLPIWRSLHSLNLMLPKEDRKAMLLRLYNEDTPLTDHHKDRADREKTAASNGQAVDREADDKQQAPESMHIDEDTGSEAEEGGAPLAEAI